MAVIEISGRQIEVDDGFLSLSPQEQSSQVDEIAQDMIRQDKEIEQISQFGHYLERQDLKNAVGDMGGLHKFGASAGVQVDKAYQGIKDLMGIGTEEQRAEETRRLEQVNDVLAEDSPKTNMGGRMFGGVLSAAPLALGAEATIPTALGMGGRMLLSGASGLIEGAVEKPFKNETRLSNAETGLVTGLVAEPISAALRFGLKQIPFGALFDKVVGGNKTIADNLRRSLKKEGVDYDSLKPETRNILESISRSDDIDVAVKDAMEVEQGFKLTKGESTGDFAQLSSEQSALRESQTAGDIMRDFKNQQNTDIIQSGDDIAESVGGNVEINNEQIGVVLKQALETGKNADKKNYQNLYNAATELASKDGVDIPLDQPVISGAFYDAATKHIGTHESLLKDIGRELARLDILDPEEFASDIPFSLPDADFKSLSVANAEDFIKFLNSKYSPSDSTGNMIIAQLKEAVSVNADDVIANALEGVDSKAAKAFLETAREARQANAAYRSLWDSKDVLNDLTGVKNGTETPIKTASDVVKRIMRNPEDARKVISELSERGNESAINDLRTFVLKDIFDGSINPNVPKGDNSLFSGSKLTALINKNESVLKEVLSPDQFGQLKAFEVNVSKATKMPEGAVNYSNTASKIADQIWAMLSPLPLGAVRDVFAKRTVKQAIKTGQQPVDHILKLDGNHIKLNTMLREVLDQSMFEDNAALSGQEETQ